ncbi:MAG: transglutaminase family protein [Pseudorhodoplanes sp.]|nr:transglutaminase family protein [Pseudorhodoplanes sp.]
MHILISHDTVYRYREPPAGIVQTLRLTPRNHASQYVAWWRIDVSADCQLDAHEDAFGNLTHTFSIENPIEELTIHVEGAVDTEDAHGIVRGAIERFPPSLFLRETSLTQADEAILAFARDVRESADAAPLSLLHALLARVHTEMTFDTDPTHASTTAAEAFALRRGVCQDLTHVFIAAARSLGVPERYVSGYFYRADGVVEQHAGHAWAEAHVPEIGWISFDPANGISGTDAHVRVAAGLDYLSAAPIRGTRYGGGAESLAVRVRVEQSMRQSQN